jgi:hypothetical protein
MKLEIHSKAIALAVGGGLLSLVLAAGEASAQTYVLEPTGTVTKGTAVENYFNGGTTANANGPGPSDNISFTYITNSSIQTDFLTGGTGSEQSKAANVPSVAAGINNNGVVFFQSVENVMNVTNGLVLSALSFDYSIYGNSSSYTSGTNDPTVTIWSGLNGTGTALETIGLQPAGTSESCPVGSGTYDFCTWSNVVGNFAGPAKSVTFSGGDIGYSEFDSITVTEAPEPDTAWLLGAGALAIAAVARARRQTR